MTDILTSNELGKALGVSGSYARRLIRLGMPGDSIQAARAWIKQKSKTKAADTATKGLTAAREEKVRLECEILTLRLERERDNVELISVREVEKFLSFFISYMGVTLTSRAESLTNELMGKPEAEMYGQFRQLFDQALFLAPLGYAKGCHDAPDPRLVAFAEKYIQGKFAHFPAQAKGQSGAEPSCANQMGRGAAMNEPLTDDQVKSLLRREYPKLFAQDIERIAKTCRSEKWFLNLVKSKRLSEDLKTGAEPIVVAANAGGVAKDEAPAVSEEKYGSTSDRCVDDPDPESLRPDRDRDIKAAEWAINLLLSTHSARVRHMRASVSLAILQDDLNLSEIAKHFDVTPERVVSRMITISDRR